MTFTANRSDAIRAGLIEVATPLPARDRRRVLTATGLLAVGALLGAGGSAAAFAANGWSSPEYPQGQATPTLGTAVQAPEGVIPGAPIISALGEPTSLIVDAATEVPMDDRPEHSTHVRVTVTCLTAGTFVWSTTPAAQAPSVTCSATEAGSRTGVVWDDVPLDHTTTALYLTASTGTAANVNIQFLNYVPTKLGVNAKGQTYGIDHTAEGMPDLIAVQGSAPDGSDIQGYVRASDLHRDSSTPLTPEQALQEQASGPRIRSIPLLASDGATHLGTFTIGK